MTVPIVPRAQWGFDGWLGGRTPYSVALSSRREFFVHYEGGSPVGRQTGPSVPRAIHGYHKSGNGWAGIGYNFVVDQNGTAFEGRGWTLVGAHCPNHNVSGIGVQVHIGGAEKPSDAALRTTRALYDEACARTGRALAQRGHRDGKSTACPGEPLYAWVRAGMPAPGAGDTGQPPIITKPTTQEDDDMAKILRITPGADDNAADDSLWLVTSDGAAAIGGNEIHSVNRILTAPPGDKVLLVEIEQYRAVCARARA